MIDNRGIKIDLNAKGFHFIPKNFNEGPVISGNVNFEIQLKGQGLIAVQVIMKPVKLIDANLKSYLCFRLNIEINMGS